MRSKDIFQLLIVEGLGGTFSALFVAAGTMPVAHGPTESVGLREALCGDPVIHRAHRNSIKDVQMNSIHLGICFFDAVFVVVIWSMIGYLDHLDTPLRPSLLRSAALMLRFQCPRNSRTTLETSGSRVLAPFAHCEIANVDEGSLKDLNIFCVFLLLCLHQSFNFGFEMSTWHNLLEFPGMSEGQPSEAAVPLGLESGMP